ncbi:MAG: penicillin-binding protein activator LpoB [Planctomycetia bacterium]
MGLANRSNRRTFLVHGLAPSTLALVAAGCRSMQFARVMMPGEDAMIGSHQAGQETFTPLVNDAVAKLLARHVDSAVMPVSYEEGAAALPPPTRRICFVGVENKSAEDIGDFKEQIYQSIDSRILESKVFQSVNRRFVDAGLRDTRLRPDQLLVPEHMRTFAGHMEQQGQPIDYLLYATITSGTTRENRDYQRDYVLTLELVEVGTGSYDKQSAELSKGYHHSRLSRWRATNPLAP